MKQRRALSILGLGRCTAIGAAMSEQALREALAEAIEGFAFIADAIKQRNYGQALDYCEMHDKKIEAALAASEPQPHEHKEMSTLHLSGKATDHIWLMEDGEEPHAIGIRVDCGDSGTLYVTREQAVELSKQLQNFVNPEPLRAPLPDTRLAGCYWCGAFAPYREHHKLLFCNKHFAWLRDYLDSIKHGEPQQTLECGCIPAVISPTCPKGHVRGAFMLKPGKRPTISLDLEDYQ